MIASLRGRFLYSDQTSVVIECSGVGYKCFVTKNTLYNLPNKNEEMFLVKESEEFKGYKFTIKNNNCSDNNKSTIIEKEEI